MSIVVKKFDKKLTSFEVEKNSDVYWVEPYYDVDFDVVDDGKNEIIIDSSVTYDKDTIIKYFHETNAPVEVVDEYGNQLKIEFRPLFNALTDDDLFKPYQRKATPEEMEEFYMMCE